MTEIALGVGILVFVRTAIRRHWFGWTTMKHKASRAEIRSLVIMVLSLPFFIYGVALCLQSHQRNVGVGLLVIAASVTAITFCLFARNQRWFGWTGPTG